MSTTVVGPVFSFLGRKSSDLMDFQNLFNMPYVTFAALAVDGSAFDLTRAVFVDADGTADITDASGNTVADFPLTKGENRLMVTKIDNITGFTKAFGAY